jgi:hypothetical protein
VLVTCGTRAQHAHIQRLARVHSSMVVAVVVVVVVVVVVMKWWWIE